MAATLPESDSGAFGLAFGLGLARLDHRVDVALEDLRLEHVEHAAQVLQHLHLTAPLLLGVRYREPACLHGGRHLFTGQRQQLAQQINHTLVDGHSLVLGRNGGLEPSGILRSEREFAELAGTPELRRPFIQMTADLTRGLLAQPHSGGGMRGQRGDFGEVLYGLVRGHAPLLVSAVQVPQIPGETGTHADQLIGDLVEPGAGDAGLESDRGDQLMVDAVIAALVRDVEHLAAELIGADGLTETTLLIGDARHVQYAAAVHHAARRDGGGVIGGVTPVDDIDSERMPGCDHIGRVPHGVVDIADFELVVRIGVEWAERRCAGVLERFGGLLAARERVQHRVAGRPFGQRIDDVLAFGKNQRAGRHEAAQDNLPLDGEIGEHLLRTLGDRREHRGRFGRATLVVGAVEQLPLVKFDVLLAHHRHERGVEPDMPDEPDHRHIAFILGALHGYRIQQHRHGTVVPCGDSHGKRQFRDAADAQFRGLLVKHPLQSAVRRTQHAVVAEQQIQRRAASREQLGDAGGMRMGQIEFRPKLVDVLQWGRHQSGAVLFMPLTHAFQRLGRLLHAFAHDPTHFPTALR